MSKDDLNEVSGPQVEGGTSESLDLRKFFGMILGTWQVYIISIAVFTIGAFLVNRYSDRIYKGKMVLNINTDGGNSNGGVEALMSQIGFYNPRLTFENELVVLNSYQLMESAMSGLDFGVEYLGKGRVRVTEYYGSDIPFTLLIDSSHVQDAGFVFAINPIDDSKVEIKVTGNSKPIRFDGNPISKDEVDWKRSNKSVIGIYNYSEWI